MGTIGSLLRFLKEARLVTCPACGAEISVDADPCPKCGRRGAGLSSPEVQSFIEKCRAYGRAEERKKEAETKKKAAEAKRLAMEKAEKARKTQENLIGCLASLFILGVIGFLIYVLFR